MVEAVQKKRTLSSVGKLLTSLLNNDQMHEDIKGIEIAVFVDGEMLHSKNCTKPGLRTELYSPARMMKAEYAGQVCYRCSANYCYDSTDVMHAPRLRTLHNALFEVDNALIEATTEALEVNNFADLQAEYAKIKDFQRLIRRYGDEKSLKYAERYIQRLRETVDERTVKLQKVAVTETIREDALKFCASDITESKDNYSSYVPGHFPLSEEAKAIRERHALEMFDYWTRTTETMICVVPKGSERRVVEWINGGVELCWPAVNGLMALPRAVYHYCSSAMRLSYSDTILVDAPPAPSALEIAGTLYADALATASYNRSPELQAVYDAAIHI